MPLNFASSTELPPLHPENPIVGSSNKLIEDKDVSKTNSWYNRFMETYKNPVSDDKIHMLMLDFFITEGFLEISQAFAQEAGFEFKPDEVRDPCNLAERDAIRNAVQKGQLAEAIDLINQLCPDLLQKNKLLNFQIRRQQLVELIRNKDVVQALQFAQDNLVDKFEQNKEELDKLEQTYALLAFDKPEESPFGKLMHSSQRLTLSSAINEAIFIEMGSQPTSRLHRILSIMAWNKYQDVMHGDINIPTDKQMIVQIARDLFADRETDEDLLMEESL